MEIIRTLSYTILRHFHFLSRLHQPLCFPFPTTPSFFSTTRSLVAHTALQSLYHVVLGHPNYKYLCLDLIPKLVWCGGMSVIPGIPSQGPLETAYL